MLKVGEGEPLLWSAHTHNICSPSAQEGGYISPPCSQAAQMQQTAPFSGVSPIAQSFGAAAADGLAPAAGDVPGWQSWRAEEQHNPDEVHVCFGHFELYNSP